MPIVARLCLCYVKVTRSPGPFTHRRVNASGSCSGERGNVLAEGNYCYVAVCSAARGASAPTEGGEGRGHVVAAARLQPVYINSDELIGRTFQIGVVSG